MRFGFSEESPLGIITLMVCLPVAAVLAYIIVYSLADVIQHPGEYKGLFLFLVGYPIATLVADAYFRRKKTSEGKVDD